MKRTLVTASLMAAGLFSLPTLAADIEVSVTNLTHGNHFTPILIAAHDADSHLFQVGTEASAALQKMAGVMLDTGDNTHLSIVAMVLPTNDAFMGLDGWEIPTEAGTYTMYVNAYDAGTEANDEIINGGGMSGVPGIPAAPGGDGGANGTGVMDNSDNSNVHTHPGVLGDMDSAGGMSDLDSRVHRWLNPVAKVVVTVK